MAILMECFKAHSIAEWHFTKSVTDMHTTAMYTILGKKWK